MVVSVVFIISVLLSCLCKVETGRQLLKHCWPGKAPVSTQIREEPTLENSELLTYLWVKAARNL